MELLLGFCFSLLVKGVVFLVFAILANAMIPSSQRGSRSWWADVASTVCNVSIGGVLFGVITYQTNEASMYALLAAGAYAVTRWLRRPPRRRRSIKKLVGEKGRALLAKVRLKAPARPALRPGLAPA